MPDSRPIARGRLETLIGWSRDVAKGGCTQYEPAIRHGGMRLPRKSIGLSLIGHNRRPAMPRPCHCRVVLPTQLVAQELRDHHDTIGRTSTTGRSLHARRTRRSALAFPAWLPEATRSEEHTSELQSL